MFDDAILFYDCAAHFSIAFYQPRPHELPYRVTFDKSEIFSVKCVVFYLPLMTELDYSSLPWLSSRKKPGQIWVIFSEESAANYPALGRPEFRALFDLEMSYRQSADIWTPYLDSSILTRMQSSRVLPKKFLAAAFISSTFNESGRLEYLQELMQYIPVHSYGTALNNRSVKDMVEHVDSRSPDAKLNLSAHYRFSLAFENSISPDYVTEKFFQPMMVGSVPVYLGAPNVSEYAPAPDCYVNASDFRSPGALAAHLLAVDDNAHHAWRQQTCTQPLQSKLDRLARQGDAFEALYRLVFETKVNCPPVQAT